MQAALRGDGGSDTNSAADIRTVKALLLNGAVKPADWTNSTFSPLDARYGAGVLNVFNSYEQLAGGKHSFNFSNKRSDPARAHPPVGVDERSLRLSGWDFDTNTSTRIATTRVNHYYFNVTNTASAPRSPPPSRWFGTGNKAKTAINNLDLFLYNAPTAISSLCSTSLVDNVEHIFVPKLAPGRYDLQVWKAAGTPVVTIVSSSETYALAWEFFSPTLNAVKSGTNLTVDVAGLSGGFCRRIGDEFNFAGLEHKQSSARRLITNNQNVDFNPATNASQFFRLRTPNF